ncbi:MAG: hypothetical protein MUO67_22350 [Anaerolineales bacterium]|nr:hypothetical protein [Anaerolineales bacterium]
MDIFLANERAFHFVPQTTVEVAIDRLEQKKTQLVVGTMGALISRPKPEDIQLVSVENRLEAFWELAVSLRTVYERNRTYTVSLSGAEIKHVTILGQDLPVTIGPKGNTCFNLNGLEHCLEESSHNFTFDGAGAEIDLSKYVAYAKNEIIDLENFSPGGVLVVPPKALASTVVRSVLAKVIKPVQAEIIHEERINVESLDINFRPIYAMEYHWVPKNKRVVLEFDALTGEIHSNGKKMADQVKVMITRDLLFDVSADAVGMLVPGGSIAVKLVKAAMDHKNK